MLTKNSLALIFFFSLVILSNCTILQHFSTHFIGGATHDAGLYVWLIQEAFPSLFRGEWFSTSAFYPYQNSLAWSDNFILPSLIATILTEIGIPLVITYNLIFLSVFTLNYFLAYKLSLYLTGDFLISIFSSIAFSSFSFLQEHLGHPQLQFAFLLPWGILEILKFFEKKNFRSGINLGIILFSCFLTTVYYAVFLVFSMVVAGIFYTRPKDLKKIIHSSLGIIIFLLLLIPFVIPYIKVKEVFGERKLYEPYYFAADIFSYITSTTNNFIYSFTSELSHSEARLFSGITILIIIAYFLFKNYPSWFFKITGLLLTLICTDYFFQRPLSLYLTSLVFWMFLLFGFRFFKAINKINFIILLAALSFIISFGPLGNPEKGIFPTSPYILAYYFVPGFDGIRAIGRIGILFHLLICILAGCCLSNLNLTANKKKLICLIVITTIFLENYNTTIPLSTLPSKPEILNLLPNDRKPAIILPLVTQPLLNGQVRSWSDFAEVNVNAMNWMINSGHPIVNGYSGIRTKLMRELPKQTKDFPSAKSIESLKKITGLEYVVTLGKANFDTTKSETGIELVAEDRTVGSQIFRIIR